LLFIINNQKIQNISQKFKDFLNLEIKYIPRMYSNKLIMIVLKDFYSFYNNIYLFI